MASEADLDKLDWSDDPEERLIELRLISDYFTILFERAIREARKNGVTWTRIERLVQQRIPTRLRRVIEEGP